MIYKLSFRPSSGGAVVPGQLEAYSPGNTEVPRSGALIGYDQVTFLIHGFNVNEGDGIYSLSEFARKLSAEPSSAIVFVLWPGDSPVSGPRI